MNFTCIIQARMGSSRFPGKVLKDIDGQTMLERVIGRVRRAKKISRIVVATTTLSEDKMIVKECQKLGVDYFPGSELDVLDRFYQTWRAFGGNSVVRITSDCPLIAPEIIDQVISEFELHDVDYASNALESHGIRGFDVEVMTTSALETAWREADQPHCRVHVTPYIYQNPDRFHLLEIPLGLGNHRFRLTVDTSEDMLLIRSIYAHFHGRNIVSARDVIDFLIREPSLAALNSHIAQKKLEEL